MKAIAVVLLAAALAAGCGSTPRESFYTLAAPPAPLPAGATGPLVAVGPVIVPEAVDRTAMVVRTGPNSVDIEDFHRWAEPLKTAIPRVLAENLMRELGTPRVTASRLNTTPPDFRVAVEIQRFDSSFAEGASLDALWTVTSARAGAAPKSGRTTITETARSADYAGIAAAHSRALTRLAADIAAAMR